MAKPSRSDKDDLRAEAEMLMDELPDETAAGRMVDDDGEPADGVEFLADRDEFFTTTRQAKQGNQPPPNPNKR